MAKDDMHLIIYKILRYIYDCNKIGKTPLYSELLNVTEIVALPQAYIGQIMSELVECGYIERCRVSAVKGNLPVVVSLASDAHITIKGVDYLSENSRII